MRGIGWTNRELPRLGALVVALWLGSPPVVSSGGEPARQFLDALLAQGYYDTAAEYLDALTTSSLVDQQFRDGMPYERATILLRQAESLGSLPKRVENLDEATELLRAFLQGQPQHPQAEAAGERLRETLRMRGQIAEARASAAPENTRGSLLSEARKLYEQTEQAYTDRIAKVREELQALQQQPAAERDAERYKVLRDEYVSAKFSLARTQYDRALTYQAGKPGSDTQQLKKELTAAREKFLEIAEKYRRRLHGFLAIYYAGRCHQELEEFDDALALYEELRAIPNNVPALRELITLATTAAMECWLTDAKQEYAKAVEAGQAWSRELVRDELRASYGVELRWTLAQAQLRAAEKARDAAGTQLRGSARELLADLARTPNPRQDDARNALAEMTGGAPVGDEGPPQPKTFAEAKAALRDAREQLQSSQFTIKLLKPKLADASDERRQEIEDQLAQAERDTVRFREQAQQLAAAALQLADRSLGPGELDEIRYFMAYNAFESQRYYEAAVLAEFVARYQPNSAYAHIMARIALESYKGLYLAAPEGDRQFEMQQLTKSAEYILQAWPDHPDTQSAVSTLIALYNQQGDLEQAQRVLEKLPDDSPQRREAELTVGQLQYRAYLQQSQQPPGTAGRPDDAQLASWKQSAQELLSRALARQQDTPDANTVQAALILSQIYLDSNNASKALSLLEDPNKGPKTLADANSPLLQQTGLAHQAYAMTLQAIIATLPTASDQAAQLAKILAIMETLKQRAGESTDGQQRLMAIYQQMALNLKQQLEVAPPGQRQQLMDGFAAFLDNVSQSAQDLPLLFWIAETYTELGDQAAQANGAGGAPGEKYYRQSADLYQKILDQAAAGTLAMNDSYRTAIRMRVAATQQRLGDYDAAFAMFEELLTENSMLLNVQLEAAEALQAAGLESDDFQLLNQAIGGRGTHPETQQSIIWGWGKISKICQSQMFRSPDKKAQFSAPFFDARYNLARCRYAQARLKDGAEREKYLNYVKRGIESLAGSYPDLGGPAQRERFDRLLKQVQKDLGEPIRGLTASVP